MSYVPTRQPMQVSNTCYVSSIRTTLCDIMCTVNASLLHNSPRPPENLKPLTATLPYKKTKQKNLKSKIHNQTLFQKLIGGENQQRLDKELRKDRDAYFMQLRIEKEEVERKRNKAATKIQALYRGYKKRRRPAALYVRHKKRRKIHTQNDMQDELCTLAATLGLKPIDGLSLEARSKTSRRKEKIMNAAAFRIHRFLSMVYQRAVALRRMEERREEIIDKCSRIITRAVRYVKVKKFVKKCENIKRQQMAIKIQCCTRIFQSRQQVRIKLKERHQRAKRLEAAIIIQRNLAPKARAYNLARLTMVAMRNYGKLAEEVVNMVEEAMLEGGFHSVVDMFTKQISDKFAVVHPMTEERVVDALIDEAVLVEMHVWLEEQMLAILAENQRIAEERVRLEALYGRADSIASDISWNNLPEHFFNDENLEACDEHPLSPIASESGTSSNSARPSRPHSLATSRIPSPNVGEGAVVSDKEGNSTRAMVPLLPPSVLHRNNFLRGSMSGIAVPQSPMRSSMTASFSMSPQHYRSVMNHLSSIDMNHSSKYQAALLAANLAANGGSFSGTDTSPSGKGFTRQLSSQLSGLADQSPEAEDPALRRNNSVRFIDNDVPRADSSPLRDTDMLPQGLSVHGIAECEEEDDEEDETVAVSAASAAPSIEEVVKDDIAVVEAEPVAFDAQPLQELGDVPQTVSAAQEAPDEQAITEAKEEAQFIQDSRDRDSIAEDSNAGDCAAADVTVAENCTEGGSAGMDSKAEVDVVSGSQPMTEQQRRQSVASEYAEAFASMSITSVLNQFRDSLVLPPQDGALLEDGSTTLQELDAAAATTTKPDTQRSAAAESDFPEYSDDGDNASDIASQYYDVSVAGSIESIDAVRHIEEWEVCRDFTAMSLTEQEKREIDQLFKDTMHAFHKAKYRKASDVLECFLPILRKFPSSDPFHPDVARVQTTIKTIKARILFEQARYADAKEVFDDALQHRIEVFGKAHYLCLELYYAIGEWHRSQAEYDAAEKYLHQASVSVAALIKMQSDASNTGVYDAKLWHAKNRILIGQAELQKQSGQYYKANVTILQVRESLKQRTSQDSETTRIQESFVCCYASILCINGKFNQAVSLHQELLDQRRYRYGVRHPKIATSLCALGSLKVLRCELPEASELLEECLTMRREVYPADHPAIAAALFAKGLAFAKLGKFPEAAADLTHSLEMRRLKLGSEHPSVAQSAMALADIQTQMGDPLRAWKNYNFALAVFRGRYGVEKHRDIAQCLFSMACNAEARGSYLEAVEYHQEALHLHESILELFRAEGTVELHLGVELSKVHLARVYALVARMEEAKGFMKDAVKNVTKILGNRNDLVARSLCHLGQLCRIRGNFADAKQLYSLAFNIIQELFGDDHPMIATAMLLSAENLRFPGMYTEALALETSAYDVRSYLFGSENISTAMAVYQRAQLLRDSGKTSDAEKQYVRVLHILVAKVGENNGLYGQVLGDYAECCRLAGQLDAAEKHFHRAIDIQKANFGEASLQVTESILNFTLLLLDLHHPAEAAEILRNRIVPAFEQLLGSAHPSCMYARANLALASQFVRFFQSHGTEEGSIVLEGVLNHPDITSFMDALRASAFAPDHPWLLRFTEGSQTLPGASNSLSLHSNPNQQSNTGDNGSVQSSVSISAGSLDPSVDRSSADPNSTGPASLDGGLSQQSQSNAFTPRGGSRSVSRPSTAPNTMGAFSPSDSESRSVCSHSNASESASYSMSYSASNVTSARQSMSSTVRRDSYSGSSYDGSYSYAQPNTHKESGAYVSQHSTLVEYEYSDDYSVGSASASLTPRGYRHSRGFSVTPGSSVGSRALMNYEESTLGSWEQSAGDEMSLDEYFSRSAATLDDDSAVSVHTMDSLLRGDVH